MPRGDEQLSELDLASGDQGMVLEDDAVQVVSPPTTVEVLAVQESAPLPGPPPGPSPEPRPARSRPLFVASFFIVGVLLGWGVSALASDLLDGGVVELDTPSLIYPQDDCVVFSDTVTLVWTPVSGAEWYVIELYSPADSTEPSSTVPVSTASYSFSYLDDGTYSWDIKAKCGSAASGWSVKCVFSVATSLDTPILSYPTGYGLVNTSAVEFQWSDSDGADRYNIQVSMSSYFGETVIDTYATEDSYVSSYAFSTSTTYFWRVVAYEQALASSWSDTEAFIKSQEASSYVYDTIDVTWNWTFPEDSSNWSYSFNVSGSDYYQYETLGREDVLISDYSKYVTAGDATIMEIADFLVRGASAENLTDYEVVWLALSFVHATAYVSDLESKGVDEYARYPIETLVDGVGDCEDTAALFTSIVRAMGYPSVMLFIYVIPGVNANHMASTVAGATMPDGSCSIEYGGTAYYFCETTAGYWTPGELPETLVGALYEVVP
jgi:transglutaminase-like putative cysteine protease